MDDPQEFGMRPSIEVRGPTGESRKVIMLTGERVRVGRPSDLNEIGWERGGNDIALNDPCVSRGHCFIERAGGAWQVVDRSRHGTWLRRGGNELRVVGVQERIRVVGVQELSDGDIICIVASGSETRYWELVFRDPAQTVPVTGEERAPPAPPSHAPPSHAPGRTRLEYDWPAARLTRIVDGRPEQITDLPPKVNDLLVYLLTRNRDNGDMPVLCSRDELMQAIWGDNTHADAELSGLVLELRERIELDRKQPRFVQTVKKKGYRLDPRPMDP